MSTRDVVLCGPVRTAIGSFNGSLRTIPATDLGATVVRETLRRSGLDAAAFGSVVMGNVIVSGVGIAYLLHVTVAQDPADGRLVEILPDLDLPKMPVSAVHAFGRQLPVRARLFIDCLSERIGQLSA